MHHRLYASNPFSTTFIHSQRPPAFYKHLMNTELTPVHSLPHSVASILEFHYQANSNSNNLLNYGHDNTFLTTSEVSNDSLISNQVPTTNISAG